MHIEVENVSKSFGHTRALRNIDLNVPPASIVAFLGENGAGKSTLLRILAGVSVPDEGVVRLDGRVMDREDLAMRKRMHFTPDMPVLFPDETVARNISTMAALYGRGIDGRDAYLAHWLEETGAAALMRRPAGMLSRGQLWKAGLACVAVIEPEVWLVDEPFASGMDALGMGAFRRLVRHLVDQGGTVLYTTQMVELAAEFSDHVCVIRDGGKVLWAEGRDVRERVSGGWQDVEAILRGENTKR